MAAGPFVREFMFTVLRTIHSQNICYDDKVCINADLVPRVSERVMHASMKEREVRPKTKELREEIKMQESILQQPISPPSRLKKVSPQQPPQPPKPQRAMQEPPLPPPAPAQQPIQQPPQSQATPQMLPPQAAGRPGAPSQDYGRINALLSDPSVSSIESSGPGKPIVIIRAGQRQFTKISLNPVETKALLEKIADSAHVPLMEGVFRAAVDNFVINAVVSEMIGSKFVIKKQTPYGLLEPAQQR
ncbi:hypothetical protein HOA55_03745 [archaeon]|nr:hypothetical protein [archaeon]MBT6820441.1 hypothetical protein [archaeon]MBT7238850.1 hypothetical protein [archaeon]